MSDNVLRIERLTRWSSIKESMSLDIMIQDESARMLFYFLKKWVHAP